VKDTEEEILALGIESTAHTFGVSVASSKRGILTDSKRTYVPQPGKGIHPREAAQHHASVVAEVLEEALTLEGERIEKIDAVGFSRGPGLGPCLRTGATVARTIAKYRSLPLIPIHHAIGHIEIAARTSKLEDPLVVLVSGGHTCITAFSGGKWRVFGETEDITLGNLLDMFAREIGLSSPGGPAVEEAAKKGQRFVNLPYIQKGNDVSYSGLLTAAKRTINEEAIEDICYSIQEVAFSALVEASERTLSHTEKKEVLLVGGVAANRRLREMLATMSKEHGASFSSASDRYSGDCGAQISWTTILAYKSGVAIGYEESQVIPKWRIDDVSIPWR
jgi:N6-L-threonylcarbamoyladenine synthase